MARVGVLLSHQHPQTDTPSHYASKSFARLVLAEKMSGRVIAETVSKNLIWVRVRMTFRELRDRFGRSRSVVIPKLLPPQEIEPSMMLQYPPTDFRSDAKRIREELWASHETCSGCPNHQAILDSLLV